MKKGFPLGKKTIKKLGRVIELVDDIEVDLERMLKSKSIILASQSSISEKNFKLNEVSMEEYFETQEQDIVSGNIGTITQHFQGFIANHAEKLHSNILDVGCGIGKDFLRYFRLLVVFLKRLRSLIVLSKLEKKFKKKVPLDLYHFHYFTKKNYFFRHLNNY